MKNRYNSLLRKHNQDILDLVPYNPFLFNVTAKEISKIYQKNDRVLEIGTGEGDSVLPILKHTNIKVDLLDVSEEMLAIAKKNLKSFKSRTKFICEDAYDYLKDSQSYNIIFSGWTVHNFNQKDRAKLLRAIYNNLAPNGCFILMDKVYSPSGGKVLLEKQNKRYTKYLLPKVASAIINHEIEDATDAYRMDEKPFLRLLKETGFKTVVIVERIERDIVIVARK